MLEVKFGNVTPFVLNVACLYPLQTSEKIPSVSDLFKGYRNIRLSLTEFSVWQYHSPGIANYCHWFAC